MCAHAHAFQIGGRWTETASGGEGLMGSPVTITWSIVPQGTIIPGRGGSNLISWLDARLGAGPGGNDLTQRPWFNYFSSAFGRWQELGGVTFVYEAHDDGFAHGNAFGELGIRGDVRIGGAFIDGPGGTLAYSGLVNQADIAIDTSDEVTFFPGGANTKFRNTLMHEIGHSLGLLHVNSPDALLLMEPFIETSFSGPQLDEILGLHRLYGDAHDAPGSNGSLGTATPLGTLAPAGVLSVGTAGGLTQSVAATAVDFVTISTSTDQDWYSFAVDAATTVDILLTPVGGTFQQSGEGGPLNTVNATAANNLSLALFGPGGLTFVDSSAMTPAGSADVINDVALAAAGTYYVRVAGTTDAAQLYQLSITRAAALAGDYNLDGTVDAADYSVWRDTLGSTTLLAADGNLSGAIDPGDLGVWRTNFGRSSGGSVAVGEVAVPEPSASLLMFSVFAIVGRFVRRLG